MRSPSDPISPPNPGLDTFLAVMIQSQLRI